jgi:putative component of membrane protein insertase Oxa1/YidC/SpoIIIJ protein YidD
LRVHGAFKGSWLALRRLLRCHPWGKFGPDPVPKLKQVSGVKCQGADCGGADVTRNTQYERTLTHHVSRIRYHASP